ncbi:PH domain-containing protein [Parerythrobacter jejuensis]|uniref:PH domain-containing protein n=1 Tax=Parerythrobacter jejuensis TaxID=795812 RepID=A0A845ART7_9SPHN|nr:PH domain-containing protein [Parerythrobacter jejuensis]MXP30832.1 PH domain-containing protein [Parerythrobacter jejuensis]MXP33592.1 PH domain-containing protein [Parerythrobacter jejuensis]
MDEQEEAVVPEATAVADTFEDADGILTRLHPNHEKAMRVEALILAAGVLAGALVLDALSPLWPGVIFGPILLIAILLVWRMPHRRFFARGYAMSDDRLRVVRGILFRSDTVVPFGRVQHIDVDRGPLERYFDLATLTLHTAGSHNASVNLPGLQHDTALAMREEIRAHIKREAL